jgi:hypothetical protein
LRNAKFGTAVYLPHAAGNHNTPPLLKAGSKLARPKHQIFPVYFRRELLPHLRILPPFPQEFVSEPFQLKK